MLRVALASAIFMPVAAFANDARLERALKQLDPDARFEQVCDLEAMKHISKDKTYRPERSMVSALSHPKVANATMSGTGGAFKSKGPVVPVLVHMRDHGRPHEGAGLLVPDRRADPAGAVGGERALLRVKPPSLFPGA